MDNYSLEAVNCTTLSMFKHYIPYHSFVCRLTSKVTELGCGTVGGGGSVVALGYVN